MHYVSNPGNLSIVDDLITTIVDNANYLSEIDGAIGDGDHGINMRKGFLLTRERLTGTDQTLAQGLKTLGTVLLTEIGGSMGPIYGSMFREMGKVVTQVEEIGPSEFSQMLGAAKTAVEGLGGAKVGDKTLIDTLAPATEAFDSSLVAGKNFADAIDAMIDAAEKGKDSTKDLVAKIGRSARLGERSKGVLDAGATSCYLLLKTFGESCKRSLLHNP